jgi:hypothetical protein
MEPGADRNAYLVSSVDPTLGTALANLADKVRHRVPLRNHREDLIIMIT